MAMMARMRSLAPWFILTVGGLFVLFMVLSDSRITDVIRARSTEIGTVNGDDITYQEFSRLLDQYRQFQVQATGQEINESQLEVFRDNVWETLVNQRLIQQKIDEFDISVTDEEIRQELLGPNPPQLVKQYFIDSTGAFNREAYEAAILNPQNKEAVLQIEDQVRQQLLQDKLKNQVNAAVMVSEAEIKQKFIDQNIKMDAEYVLVNWSTIPDTAIEVNDKDIERYYREHKEDYKIDPERKIKYVLFRKEATRGDSIGIKNNLEAIIAKLKSDTSSFKTYVEIYSEQTYSKDTLQLTRIPKGAQIAIANSNEGDIVGPLLTTEGYIVYRIVDIQKSEDNVVRASHILIPADPNKPDDNSEAMQVYNQLISGANFEDVAKEVSQDPSSAVSGGDLGWFGKGQMVREFENAAFNGKIGEIQKPVKSQFGWHIIKVTGKSNNNFVLEKIVNKIEPSPTTLDRIFQDAGDFAYLAEEDGFDQIASQLGYDVVETTFFNEEARSVPGLGSNKALIVFTFDNSVGTISPVFRVPSGYAVAAVSEIKKGSYKPLEEVKASIDGIVKREKKKDKSLEIARQIKNKIGDSGNFELAKEIDPAAKTGSVQNFTTAGTVATLGREFSFAETAFNLEPNKISEALLGNRGSFIIKVTRKDAFDSTAYSLQRTSLRDNLLNQKKNKMFSQWLQKLKEDAAIVDNRHLFYQ